jgi:putative endonuclease
MEYEKQPAVYIMASRYRGTLYIGVTSDLWTRVANHKNGSMGGFTSQYHVKTLVWYEHHETMEQAIKRETQMKAWKRLWKIELVEAFNPHWRELSDEIAHRPHQPQ